MPCASRGSASIHVLYSIFCDLNDAKRRREGCRIAHGYRLEWVVSSATR